jgi:hypothetical protein
VLVRNVPYGAITIEGGGSGANGNRVDGVAIINDSVAFNGSALAMFNSSQASSTRQISNVAVVNTIFWMNDREVFGSAVAGDLPSVSRSLVDVDPHFVSAQDLHVQAGSPAINAGVSARAPTADIDDGARDSAPDIGAYEFGATARPRLSVDVEELGGMGTVSSNPAGIACGTNCEAAFDRHTAATLTAAAAAGSRFTGWSGGCSGTGACTVTLDAAASVTATFAPPAAKPTPKPVPKCRKSQKPTKKKPCHH